MSYHAYLRRLKHIERAAFTRYAGGFPFSRPYHDVDEMFADIEMIWSHTDRLNKQARRLYDRSRQTLALANLPLSPHNP